MNDHGRFKRWSIYDFMAISKDGPYTIRPVSLQKNNATTIRTEASNKECSKDKAHSHHFPCLVGIIFSKSAWCEFGLERKTWQCAL
eukprot:2109523-Amphidinium_carterae.1